MQRSDFDNWFDTHCRLFANVARWSAEHDHVKETWFKSLSAFSHITVDALFDASKKLHTDEPKGLFPSHHLSTLLQMLQPQKEQHTKQSGFLSEDDDWQREFAHEAERIKQIETTIDYDSITDETARKVLNDFWYKRWQMKPDSALVRSALAFALSSSTTPIEDQFDTGGFSRSRAETYDNFTRPRRI